VSVIASSGPAVRAQISARPLVVVLSDGHRLRHGVGSAVVRRLTGPGVDVTVIGCDADEVALLRSLRGRGLVVVVDPSHAGPVRRFEVPGPDNGRLIVFTVETGDPVDTARQVADAVAAEIAVHTLP
jgi:hypothetical protein